MKALESVQKEWIEAAQASQEAFKKYDSETGYTENLDSKCTGAKSKEELTLDSLTKCKEKCNERSAWTLTSGDYDESGNCYGIQYKEDDDTCIVLGDSEVVPKKVTEEDVKKEGAEETETTVGIDCYVRVKSALGKAFYDLSILSNDESELKKSYDSTLNDLITKKSVVETIIRDKELNANE